MGEEAEETVEVEEVVGVELRGRATRMAKLKVVKVAKNIQDTRVQDILINLRSKVADATGFTEKELIFVRNQGHALGKTSTLPSLINEIQTNSASKKLINCYTTYYMTRNRKYMH